MSSLPRAQNPAVTLTDRPDLALVPTLVAGPPSFVLLDPPWVRDRPMQDDDWIRDSMVGFLSVERPVEMDHMKIYPVSMAAAAHGFGPILYESAMALLTRGGHAGVTPGSEVSQPAARVWENFYRRSDYLHEPLRGDFGYHDEGYLDLWYAPLGKLHGIDRAVRNGQVLIDDMRRLGYRSDEAETLLYEAGETMFKEAMHGARNQPSRRWQR